MISGIMAGGRPVSQVVAGVTARHWRIAITANQGAGYSVLTELWLMNGSTTLNAAGKTYSATGYYPGYGPDKLFDQSVAYNNYIALAASASPEWAAVDMGSPVSVTSVGVESYYNATAAECPKDFAIEYSADGSAWSTFASVVNASFSPLGVRRDYSYTG